MKDEWGRGFRIIAHIDMDAFYASIEALDNPELKGRPIIVGGVSGRGVVSAASYEARRFGVHSAMPMYRARKLCPNGVFLPVRINRYREVSKVVIQCLENFSPLVEQISIDEAYVDLTGTRLIDGGVIDAAKTIKGEIFSRTSLTCSVGVSTSKLVAKIASDMDKPDGLTVVAPVEVLDFLASLPIEKVPGVGAKSKEKLNELGVRLVGDLRRFKPGELVKRFGRFGEWLERVAYGIDDSPVVPYHEPRSISAERTLEKDTSDISLLKREVLDLSERVGRRLRARGFTCRTVVLKLRLSDLRRLTRRVTLRTPTQSSEVIFREAFSMLRGFSFEKDVRLVGVGVTGLESRVGTVRQASLFEEKDSFERKWEKAERAIDEVIRRFGSDALKRGTLKED